MNKSTVAGTFRASFIGEKSSEADRYQNYAAIGILALISAAFFYAAISRSVADDFWMDEILAVAAARQPTPSGIWDAIWSGTDFSPPTYHFMLHWVARTFGHSEGHLVWRAPSIIAIYGTAFCTYVLVRPRLSPLVATLSFGIVLALALFDYAVQARQYALLSLGLAASMLIWSGFDDLRIDKARVICLWLVLTACLSLHFYGIIEVAAVASAELIYALSRRRVRPPIWIALLLTMPMEIILYPLASHLAKFNAGDNLATQYYAKPTIGRFIDAIFQVFGGGKYGAMLLLTAFLIIGIAYFIRNTKLGLVMHQRVIATRTITSKLSRLEMVMIALCMLPVVAFGFSFLITKSFNLRYMVAGAILPAIAFPYMLDQYSSRRFVALALSPIIGALLLNQAHSHNPNAVGPALTALRSLHPMQPVVVGEGLLYIELMESADAATKARLVFLKSPPGSESPDPTNENAVVRLATTHSDYQVSDQRTFLDNNSRFYVISRPSGTTDTTTPSLIEKGLLAGPLKLQQGILQFESILQKKNHD